MVAKMSQVTEEQELETKARDLAMTHGAKIAIINREGACTNAYLELTRERRWSWPRGLHTGDLLATYMDHHWMDFVDEARIALASPPSGE